MRTCARAASASTILLKEVQMYDCFSMGMARPGASAQAHRRYCLQKSVSWQQWESAEGFPMCFCAAVASALALLLNAWPASCTCESADHVCALLVLCKDLLAATELCCLG